LEQKKDELKDELKRMEEEKKRELQEKMKK
jgi:hypothetical protein